MSSWTLNRRALLRGAGAGSIAIALPPLEAMFDSRGRLPGRALAAEGAPPVRVMTFFWPNGAYMEEVTPKTVGPGYELPKCLVPFKDVKSKLLVVTGLKNEGAQSGSGDSHEKGRVAFATAVPTPSGQASGGPSLDQYLAQKLGSATKFPSLVVAPSEAQGQNSQFFAWAAANRPVQPEIHPSVLFAKLFGGAPTAPTVDLAALRKKRRSVLDFVKGDVGRLEKKLGANDKLRLDAHLDAVREIERRIGLEEQMGSAVCQMPAGPPQNSDEATRLAWGGQKDPWQWMYNGAPLARYNLIVDLTVAALRCDLTRYVNFSLNNIEIGSWLRSTYNDTRGHHDISHDNSATEIQMGYTRYQLGFLADLMMKLDKVPEATGTLLDHTIIYASSEISHGGAHNYTNMPVLVGGGGGGKIRTGQHVNLMKFLEPGRWGNVPTGDWVDLGRLFLSIAKAAGVRDATSWGAAKQSLDVIEA